MIRNIYDLGLPSAPATLIPHLSSWWQPYSKGAIMFHSETAFEIHGKILERYNSLSDSVKETLGYLISDEQPTYKPHGRKSMFQSGAIYWSPTTGAFEVAGEIFQDYQATGESETWGFPVEEALPANGGLLQQMQRATWYFKYGTRRAHAVEGEILAAFAKTGGLGRWGYPISNEVTIDVTGIGSRDVRWSEFENGSFYWSAATGAHAVEGDIRTKWRYLGGADMHYIQELGLPTTDEMDVPDRKGARMSGFEQGVVLWYGSKDKMLVVYPFKLCICTLSTARSGSTEGPNDIYFTAIVNRGEETIFVRRYPETKAFAKADEVDVNVELPVVLKPQTDASILLKVDVWDHEESGEHLNLGTWVQVLDASNAWGLEGGGKLNSGHIQKIKNISAEIKPQIEYLYD
ncbi:hypothetical protein K432DRAFT_102908 [Lepidopterella palustris CBS 459.81]|uniref:Uncharacterized protein n=1 Tax=Lepidopterella palustris CBS 459.81 TaxID=1314670 RepID=A0A8E2JCY2_9PEZI|nr:hypothetical protein K432DRAFT_102908 [Lepidopterella palustris CBS 459.81]